MNSKDYNALPDNVKPLANEIMKIRSLLDDMVRSMADADQESVNHPGQSTNLSCSRHPGEVTRYTCKSCIDELLGVKGE